MMEDRAFLINQFKTFSPEEKHEKIQIYLHAVQKSNPNFIGLYGLFMELGYENISDEIMMDLYTTLLDIGCIGRDYAESGLEKSANILRELKENIKNENSSNDIFNIINSF